MTGTTDEAVQEAATRLLQAFESGVPCSPVRDLIGSTSADRAYEVQSILTQHRLSAGSTVVGHKIGLTSEKVQIQLGIDQPDFGLLFDDMLVDENVAVPAGALIQPRAEAEIAFILAADIDGPDIDRDVARAAIGSCAAAIEIVDSRINGWDLTITDTIADNASAGLFVLGESRVSLDGFEPKDVEMVLRKDGEDAASGRGIECLGDPIDALTWLAKAAHSVGNPLKAGDIVLSGALGPMISVEPGCRVDATITGLGSVSVSFAAGATDV